MIKALNNQTNSILFKKQQSFIPSTNIAYFEKSDEMQKNILIKNATIICTIKKNWVKLSNIYLLVPRHTNSTLIFSDILKRESVKFTHFE